MNMQIITALIAFAGTVIGTFGGILAANRLTTYRIEQLEKKVDKHNNLVERMYGLEEQVAVHDEKFRALENAVIC